MIDIAFRIDEFFMLEKTTTYLKRIRTIPRQLQKTSVLKLSKNVSKHKPDLVRIKYNEISYMLQNRVQDAKTTVYDHHHHSTMLWKYYFAVFQ